jgi:hypothetical protein
MEMYYYFYGKCPSSIEYVRAMKAYGVGPVDLHVFHKHMIVAKKIAEYGGVLTGPSKVGIAWWKRRVGPRVSPRPTFSIPR